MDKGEIMNDLKFRDLVADEIDVRIGSFNKNNTGCTLLLYKDARCDMNILDETVGPFGWKRSHDVVKENLFATVCLWDSQKSQWVCKQDVGTESYSEKEKGESSDSFKRACFNWGIGRKLYTAPFIWIKGSKEELKYENFYVKRITYDDVKIVGLEIATRNTDDVIYSNLKPIKKEEWSHEKEIELLIKDTEFTLDTVAVWIEKKFKKTIAINKLNASQFSELKNALQEARAKKQSIE